MSDGSHDNPYACLRRAKERGLYDKYTVTRQDGKPLKGGAIVLELGDPIARVGIFAWAEEMQRQGYQQVYEDVTNQLARAVAQED